MDRYEPEMFTFILTTIKNIMLIATTGLTICTLFYYSRSWYSLLAILMLFGLTSGKFIRD